MTRIRRAARTSTQLGSLALALALALTTATATATPGRAQQDGRAGAPSPVAPSGDALVFEREVFRYPTLSRRSPFRPLVGNEAGPRFEQVVLRGVLYSELPDRSVALLALRAQAEQQAQAHFQQQLAQQEAGTGPPVDSLFVPEATRRLRAGESWGNIRILHIQTDRVVVAVTDFGQTEQRTLTMLTRRQGAPR